MQDWNEFINDLCLQYEELWEVQKMGRSSVHR